MEAQKPLLSDDLPSQSNRHDHPTTAHGGNRLSETESLIRLFQILANELTPPPWFRRCAIAFIIIYSAPFVLCRWFDALARLIVAYRRWQQGDVAGKLRELK